MRPLRILLACAVPSLVLAAAGPAALADAPRERLVTGTVRVVVVDDGPGRVGASAAPAGSSGPAGGNGMRTIALADVAGRLVTLPAGPTSGLASGDRVTLALAPGAGTATVRSVERRSGTRAQPGAAAPSPVAPSPVAPGAPQPGAVASDPVVPITGTHTLTVLPVYWSTPDTSTRTSLSAVAAATAAYWSAQSGGRIAITPTVRDWMRITDPGSCDSAVLATAALAAAHLPLPSSSTDHVVVYFPNRADCHGWAGLGQVEGNLIWDNGYPLTDVLAHEFGHNLGLGHANTATCTDAGQRVTLSSTCTVTEYRDYADVMGAAMDRPTGNLNPALADRLGLVTVATVQPGTRATVDLVPPGQGTGTRAVRIRTGTAWLYVDDRPATAPDTRMPAWAGVQLHLLPDGTYPASRLLDGQPDTATAFAQASLRTGVAWPVPGAGLTLTVLSAGLSGARVTVEPTTSGAAAPVPTLTAPAPRALVAASLGVSWRVTADAVVRVLVDGTVRYTSPVGRTGSTTLTGVPDGARVLTAQVVDAAGTVLTTSTPVPVTVDGTPPGMPPGLTLTATDVLTWRAAVDTGSGVAGYLVALAGGPAVRVGSVTTVRVRTPTGRHTWWVAALDRAGNVSPAAGIVAVRSGGTGATLRVTGPVSLRDVPRTLTTTRTVSGSRPL